MQSRRTSKMAEMLRQELSSLLLFEVEKPELSTAWISQVEVSGDMKKAFVWYRLREGSAKNAATLFPKVVPFFRRRLAQKLDLRYVPELEFRYDADGDSRDRVLGLLHGLSAPSSGPSLLDRGGPSDEAR